MIGKHCGESLVTISDNRFYFRKRCQVCGAIFKQKKRLPVATTKEEGK
jgi:hypothetical protein